MVQVSKHGSPEFVGHLLVLKQLRDKSKRIHRKIEEVTERLEQAQRAFEPAAGSLSPPRDGDGLAQATLGALKELDNLLGQPDLITRDELRSHLQDLIVKLEEPRSD